MAIVTRTKQELRHDLARMMSDHEAGTASTGSTTWMTDADLNYLPDDHFNGWELTTLFGVPQSRFITNFTGTSGSVVFSPVLTSATISSTVPYEMHHEFRKLEYDAALNNAIRSVADVALIDKVDTIIYRSGLQTYSIPDSFVGVYDVQAMDNSDGISLRYGMGSNPDDIVLGTNGVQNYLRISQSILTKSNVVTYCPAVALLLRNAGGDTTSRSMRVAIYSDDGSGAPSAALYISGGVASSVLDEIPRWVRFPFATQARLAANTRYHIVLYDGDTDAARRYGWLENNDGAYESEAVYAYYSTTGVRQIETLTVLGSAASQGAIKVTVTAAGMPSSPVTVVVDLAAGDTATTIGGKIRTALAANAPDVVSFFSIGGATTTVQLTAKAPAANDPTMNISIADGSWQGITEVPFSANTTPGVTAGTKQVETATVVGTITAGTQQVETATLSGTSETGIPTDTAIVTAADMTNSPVSVDFSTPYGASAATCATNLRTALNANPNITNFFTIGGSGADVTFTAKTPAANDATMAVTLAGLSGLGITSADTTAGVASGAGTVEIVVTADGMTGSPVTSTDVDVAAGDTATQVASKIAAQLTAENANISNFFTITASGEDVIFTAKTAAANDATMNVALDNGSCSGLTPAATSADTTAGVAASEGTIQVETTTVVGTVNGNGWLRWVVTAANMSGSPVTGQLYVVNGQTAEQVAAALRASLRTVVRDSTGMFVLGPVGQFFNIGGSGADVILTAKASAANDATMNLAIANGSYAGITAVPSSTNTTAGAGAIVGAWTSLSTTTGQSFVLYSNDPNWLSIAPSLWRVTRTTTRSISVNKTLPDGTPIRLLGFKAPTTMEAEDSECPINSEFVTAKAAALLCASKIRRSDNDPDAYAMQARFWDEQAERIRARIRTRFPANYKLVEVQ